MFKILSASQTQNDHLKSKCGEIHFQTSNFYFLCIFCGSKIETYNEFKVHFENEHLNTFSNIQLSSEKSTDTLLDNEKLITTKADLEDPLDCNFHTFLKETTTSNINTNNQEKFNSDIEMNNTLATGALSEQNDTFEDPKNDALTDFDFSNEPDTEAAVLTDIESTTYDNKIDWNKPYQSRSLKHHTKRLYKPRDKLNSCTYCGRTFRRRYQLDTHINIHTGAKPHQCDICGRQFRAIVTLKRHLITHEQRSIFICKFCYKSFTHKAALLSHESRHTQERNVPCDECEKRFYTLNQCDTHKLRVHKKSNETLPFVCDLCPNRYRTASMLSTHKKRKHYKSAKFTCDKCQKKFIDSKQLEEHQSIHVIGYTVT